MEGSPRARSALGEFWADVVAALAVCGRQPLLPVLSIAVGAIPSIAFDAIARSDPACVQIGAGCGATAVLVFAASVFATLFWIGWVGTERFWYARAWNHEPMPVGELWTLTWRFFGRYFRLGLLVLVGLVPTVIVPIGIASSANAPSDVSLWIVVAAGLILDVLLTFATPALAFTTHKATAALRIGWRMLRHEWPRSAAYAFVPPLAFASFSALTVQRSFLGSSMVSVGSTLLLLFFRGGTARFYLRRYDDQLGTEIAEPHTNDLGRGASAETPEPEP